MSNAAAWPGNTDLSQAEMSVEVERSIRATPERIWQVIGNADGMRSWMNMLNFQPKVGGRMLIDSSGASESDRLLVFGRVLEIREPQLLRMSWRVLHEDGRLWPAATELSLIVNAEDDGCVVRLLHSGFEKLAGFGSQAYSVYHHCWVQTPYLQRLEDSQEARA